MRRREVLGAIVALAGTTGCLGATSDDRSDPTASPTRSPERTQSPTGSPRAAGDTVTTKEGTVTVAECAPRIDASLYRVAEDTLRVFTADEWLFLVPVSATDGDVGALGFELQLNDRIRPNPEPFDVRQQIAIDGDPVVTAGPTVTDNHWLVFPVRQSSSPPTPVVRWTDPDPSVAWQLENLDTTRLAHARPAV